MCVLQRLRVRWQEAATTVSVDRRPPHRGPGYCCTPAAATAPSPDYDRVVRPSVRRQNLLRRSESLAAAAAAARVAAFVVVRVELPRHRPTVETHSSSFFICTLSRRSLHRESFSLTRCVQSVECYEFQKSSPPPFLNFKCRSSVMSV